MVRATLETIFLHGVFFVSGHVLVVYLLNKKGVLMILKQIHLLVHFFYNLVWLSLTN